jgi:hypothetical protein
MLGRWCADGGTRGRPLALERQLRELVQNDDVHVQKLIVRLQNDDVRVQKLIARVQNDTRAYRS